MLLRIFSFIVTSGLSFALPVAPLAGSAKNCAFQNIDFIPAEEGIRKISLPAAVLSATTRIQLPLHDNDKFSETCSASYVSDSGTVLTAGHCLSDCLSASGGLIKYESEGSTNAVAIDQKAIGSICKMSIGAQPEDYTIVAARFCGVRNRKKLSAESLAYCANSPDFAILQPVKPDPSHPCLKLDASSSAQSIGRPVAVIGFPSKTERHKTLPYARESDGNSQYLTFGNVMRSANCTSPIFGPPGANLTRTQSVYDNDKIKSDYLQLSADAVKGNSGGPVVDPKTGRVMGIMSVVANEDSHSVECAGSAFATSTTQMTNELRKAATEALLNQIFSCNKNAAVKH